jgi:hypothetical protein
MRQICNLGEDCPLCTEQAASTVDSVAVQNILCWLACSVHNGPPSPKFQILPSQLRQTADRAAGLCIKSLGLGLPGYISVQPALAKIAGWSVFLLPNMQKVQLLKRPSLKTSHH